MFSQTLVWSKISFFFLNLYCLFWITPSYISQLWLKLKLAVKVANYHTSVNIFNIIITEIGFVVDAGLLGCWVAFEREIIMSNPISVEPYPGTPHWAIWTNQDPFLEKSSSFLLWVVSYGPENSLCLLLSELAIKDEGLTNDLTGTERDYK